MGAYIAVVDPDPRVFALVRTINESAFRRGFDVRYLPRGDQALKAFAASPPAVVVMATDLPDLPGVTVLERMQSDARLQAVPVLVLTQGRDEKLPQLAHRAGAATCLRKPLDQAALTTSLRLLAHSWAQRRPADAEATDVIVPAQGPPKRLLIVEDDADLAMALQTILAHPLIHFRLAANGIEGLAYARHFKPDLILLDAKLPAMDGFAVFGVLRRDFDLTAMRVLFLSAHAEQGALALTKELGAFAWMRKPFDPNTLRRKVLEGLALDEAFPEATPTPSPENHDESGAFYDVEALDDAPRSVPGRPSGDTEKNGWVASARAWFRR